MGFKKIGACIAALLGLLMTYACQNNKTTPTTPNISVDSLLKVINNLKVENTALRFQVDSLRAAFQVADSVVKKQNTLAQLRTKAETEPLSLEMLSVQNTALDKTIINAQSPFKRQQVRFIRFNLKAKNNYKPLGQALDGQLFMVMSKGSMIQSLASGSGSFTNQDGKSQLYTKMWPLQSQNPSITYSAGIGDAKNGIFEPGNWTLEFWFKPKDRKTARPIGKTYFQIL